MAQSQRFFKTLAGGLASEKLIIVRTRTCTTKTMDQLTDLAVRMHSAAHVCMRIGMRVHACACLFLCVRACAHMCVCVHKCMRECAHACLWSVGQSTCLSVSVRTNDDHRASACACVCTRTQVGGWLARHSTIKEMGPPHRLDP